MLSLLFGIRIFEAVSRITCCSDLDIDFGGLRILLRPLNLGVSVTWWRTQRVAPIESFQAIDFIRQSRKRFGAPLCVFLDV